MKYLLSFLLSLPLFAAPSGLYLESNLGAALKNSQSTSTQTLEYKDGFEGAVALGYQLDLWRVELEADYVQNAVDSNSSQNSDLKRQSALLNLYFSGYNDSHFVSTVGIGLGISNLNLDQHSRENLFSYQASFSVGYMFDESWTLSLRYRYFGSSSFSMDGTDYDPLSQNHVTAGLRYLF